PRLRSRRWEDVINRQLAAWLVFAIAFLFAAASGRHARAGAAISPKSGAAMCALTPADFQSAGVANAAKPTANVQDGGGSVYCVHAGRSTDTAGIDSAAVYPAGSNDVESKATYKTAIDEGPALKPLNVAGADEAHWSPSGTSGGPPFATVTVRRKNL